MRNGIFVAVSVVTIAFASPAAHAQSAGGSSSSSPGASSPGGAGASSSGAGFSSGGPSPSSPPPSGGTAGRNGTKAGNAAIGGTTATDLAEQKRSNQRMTICKGC